MRGPCVGEGLIRERPVEGRHVEPVERIGNHRGDGGAQGGGVGIHRSKGLAELLPGRADAVGVAGEQLAVVPPDEFSGDERPHVVDEIDRTGSGEQTGDRGGGEDLAGGRLAAQRRRHLRAVRHAAARAQVQAGFGSRGFVRQVAVDPCEASASALGEQDDGIDGCQPHPADDHVLARAQHRQVGVGRESGLEVGQALARGGVAQGARLGGGFAPGVAEGVDEHIGVEAGAVVEGDLPPVGGVVDPLRARRAPRDIDTGRRYRHRAAPEPVEVDALQPPRGKAVAAQLAHLVGQRRVVEVDVGKPPVAHARRPLDERGTRPHGTGDQARVIGEDRHVARHGVELEQRRLLAPPDAPRARRERIDERDPHRRVRARAPREQALDQHDRARSCAEHHESRGLHAHRTGVATGGSPSGSCRVAPSSYDRR